LECSPDEYLKYNDPDSRTNDPKTIFDCELEDLFVVSSYDEDVNFDISDDQTSMSVELEETVNTIIGNFDFEAKSEEAVEFDVIDSGSGVLATGDPFKANEVTHTSNTSDDVLFDSEIRLF